MSETDAICSIQNRSGAMERSAQSQDPFSESLSCKRNMSTKKISNVECFIHFLKGNIGSGLLGIPYAMSLVGITIGPPILTVVAILCCMSTLYLLQAGTHIRRKYSLPPLGYSEVVDLCFQEYFGKDNKWGRISVDTFLVVGQFGASTVYVILIATNLKITVDNYLPQYVVSVKVYIVVELIFLMLISLVWTLKKLALISMAGNVFVVVGLTSIMVYVLSHISFHNLEPIYVKDYTKIPNFISIAVFAFEAIGLVLPLENQMKTPESFPPILVGGILTTLVIQIVFGLLGYICFRDSVGKVITYSLPRGAVGVLGLISVAINIYFTYPLVFYVPISILLKVLTKKFPSIHSYDLQFGLRTFFVLVTFGFAIVVPKIELFIQFVGASGGIALAFIYPPISYLMVFKLSRRKKISAIITLIFGVVSCIVGTTIAIIEIVKELSK